MNYFVRWIFALIILVGLTACNLNLGYQSIPQAWIDAPLDGMVLPLAPYDIIAHASDPTGISQIEISINGSVIGTAPGSGALFNATQPWTPSEPGEYLIQARGINSGGVWSEYAEVRVFVQGDVPLTPEATEAGPPATQSVPTLILIQNANCRFGPSQVFEAVDSALAGGALPIEGKNEDETWWLVKLPSGEKCWISAVTGNANGNLGNVPVVQGPPTPEPVILGCYVYDPNLQPICTVPCPQNANPGGMCTP